MIPRSRSTLSLSKTCLFSEYPLLAIVPVASSSLSASVLLPWSICAIMPKFLHKFNTQIDSKGPQGSPYPFAGYFFHIPLLARLRCIAGTPDEYCLYSLNTMPSVAAGRMEEDRKMLHTTPFRFLGVSRTCDWSRIVARRSVTRRRLFSDLRAAYWTTSQG